MLYDILIFFSICVLSGVFTGLLGIGGGLIIIPVFSILPPLFGIKLDLQHIIGISATSIFLNSAIAMFYRRKEPIIIKKDLKGLALAVIVGTVSGSLLSSNIPDKILYGIYIVLAIYSFHLMFKSSVEFNLNKFVRYPVFALIGAVGASIGLGGAILFSVALKSIYKEDCKQLLSSVTLLMLIGSIFMFFTKLFLGNILVAIIPIVLAASFIGAKIGIEISKYCSAKSITIIMAIMLCIGLVRAAFGILT